MVVKNDPLLKNMKEDYRVLAPYKTVCLRSSMLCVYVCGLCIWYCKIIMRIETCIPTGLDYTSQHAHQLSSSTVLED